MKWLKLAPLLPLALAACQRQQAQAPRPAGSIHFVREQAWRGDGKWFYPQEMAALDQTGLASVAPPDHPALTTDGEVYDPTALAAAHQTLQLPAIVTVTNLENGLQITVRVNDRGPANPARVIELTPRAAELLRISAGQPAEVRIQLQPDQTQALAAQLGGGTLHLKLKTDPTAAVTSQNLAPPPGVRAQSNAAVVSDAPADTTHDSIAVPLRLPERVVQTTPHPGQLYIRADNFGRYDYALREAALLSPYGTVISQFHGGEERFYVRGGPYPSVAAADAALKQALRFGLRDASITVE